MECLFQHTWRNNCVPSIQVITTINYPTETIKLLAGAPDWQVVVVADKKTPEDWVLDNVIMLSIEQQKALMYSIMALLPFNHYGCAMHTIVH